ncbi:MAG: DUF481 domain-containing protein [Myxococcota bacterium]
MRTRRVRACVGAVATLWLGFAVPASAQDADPAADPPPDPPKRWEGSLALGGSLRAGDESRYGGNAEGMLKRLWERDTLTWTAFGNYGKTGGDEDANDFGSKLEQRHAFNGRFFWLTSAAADHDAIQARNLRFQTYTGPGYRIWEASDARYLDASVGLGYRHERFRNAPNNDLLDARSGYEYKDLIGEVLEVVHRTDVFTPLNDIDDFLAKSELVLSVPLFSGLHFRNHARYEYVNKPADGKEESNFWLTIGLEYRFDR